MMANVTSPALIAAEAAANSQNTLGRRPCNCREPVTLDAQPEM